MKRLRKMVLVVVLGFIIALMANNLLAFADNCEDIRGKVLRLHILANSDTQDDQNLKLLVRDEILKNSENLFYIASSKDEAKNSAVDKIEQIEEIAQNVVNSQGYSYKVNAEVVNMFFTTREYDDFTLPAGYYDAVRITIGQASGHNWWCVLYPALCIGSVTPTNELNREFDEEEVSIITEDKAKYKVSFAVVELFETVLEYFR